MRNVLKKFHSKGVNFLVWLLWQGDVSIYFTVFASDRVPVHVMNKDQAEEFYATNIGTPALGVFIKRQIPYFDYIQAIQECLKKF